MSDTVSRAADALRGADVPPMPKELAAATVAALPGRIQTRTRRRMMRIGIGAALAAGVLVGAGVLWNGGTSAVAQVAAAAAKAEKVKSVRMVRTEEWGGRTRRVTAYIMGLRTRLEKEDGGVEIMNFVTGVETRIHPPTRSVSREAIRPSILEHVGRIGLTDMLTGLRNEPGVTLVERPDEPIHGRPAAVFDYSAPKAEYGDGYRDPSTGRIWIDRATGLPVRWRSVSGTGNSVTVSVSDYDQWGRDFDPALFREDAPAGYTVRNEKERDVPPPQVPAELLDAAAAARSAASVRLRHTTVSLADGRVTAEESVTLTADAARVEERLDAGAVRVMDFRAGVQLLLRPADRTAEAGPRPEVEAARLAALREVLPTDAAARGYVVRRLRRDGADAYQIDDPGAPGRESATARSLTVWVDPATRMPARYVAVAAGGGAVRTVVFEAWNEPVDEKLLRAEAPPGYTRKK